MKYMVFRQLKDKPDIYELLHETNNLSEAYVEMARLKFLNTRLVKSVTVSIVENE